MRRLLALALLVAALSGCSDAIDADLVGTWRLVEAQRGSTSLRMVADHPITLTIEGRAYGYAGGSGGCND